MALNDVVSIKVPWGTREAIETAAGLNNQTPPDYCRAALARALAGAARQLLQPVRPTRRAYPQRGGIETMIADVEGRDG